MADRGRLKRERVKGGRSILPPAHVPDTGTLTPHFAFDEMVVGYCIADCDRDLKAAFADALWSRSKMTWLDITLAPRHGLGSEQIRRGSIKVPIPRTVTEDVDHFLAVRFQGLAPMVGYRVGRVFHVLWLDHTFTVYDH